jgi:formamidopyrimidine-DNA glycosylase
MEAWRRALDGPVSAFPIEKAGPAHIATLKTFDPPLSTLEGRRLAGARRRAKRLLFPTDDDELVLMVHLMTSGRLRYLQAGDQGPKSPAFRLGFQGGAALVLTEASKKKAAGVWLLTPEQVEAELAHLGPEALGIGADRLAEICSTELAAPRPASRRRHRARLGERDPARREALAVRALPGPLARRGRAPRRGDRLGAGARLERVDFEQHTIYYCPTCQTGGRVLKDRRLSRLLR